LQKEKKEKLDRGDQISLSVQEWLTQVYRF